MENLDSLFVKVAKNVAPVMLSKEQEKAHRRMAARGGAMLGGTAGAMLGASLHEPWDPKSRLGRRAAIGGAIGAAGGGLLGYRAERRGQKELRDGSFDRRLREAHGNEFANHVIGLRNEVIKKDQKKRDLKRQLKSL